MCHRYGFYALLCDNGVYHVRTKFISISVVISVKVDNFTLIYLPIWFRELGSTVHILVQIRSSGEVRATVVFINGVMKCVPKNQICNRAIYT